MSIVTTIRQSGFMFARSAGWRHWCKALLFISVLALVANLPRAVASARADNLPSVKLVERAFISVPHESFPIVAFSRDNRLLAEASRFGNVLRLWDWRTGKVVLKLSLEGDVDPSGCHNLDLLYSGKNLMFSPDGKFLAASWVRCRPGPSVIVRIWNAATGNIVMDIPPSLPGQRSIGIDFSPDGQHFVVAWNTRPPGQMGHWVGYDGFTQYQTSDWHEEYTHEFASAGSVQADGSRSFPEEIESGPEFSPDGKHLLFLISRSRQVPGDPARQDKVPLWIDYGHYGVVWDLQTRRVAAQRLVRWAGGSRSVAGFSSDGQFVVSENGDHQFYTFNPRCKPPIAGVQGFDGNDDFCEKIHRIQQWDWGDDSLISLYKQASGFDDHDLPIDKQRCGYLLRAVGENSIMVECVVGYLGAYTKQSDRRDLFQIWDAAFRRKLFELNMDEDPSLTFLITSPDRRFVAFEASNRKPYIDTAGFRIYEILITE